MASKKGAKFTIQGDVLLRANLAVDQVEAQIQKINQGFNNFSLGDKSTKNLEGTVTRIKDQMMALRAQSAKGFLDSDELNEYYAQSKKLTKEQDSLARMMRSMPNSQIIIDSAELRKAQAEIVSAREALESFKKTLDFDTSGYGDATADIIKLSDQMASAAKNSKSVQEAFDGIRRDRAQKLAAASGEEGDRYDKKDKADKRVQALTEEFEAYKKLNDEIQKIGKSGKYSDDLVEALKGAKKFTEGKEALAGLTTNEAKKAAAIELVKKKNDELKAAIAAAEKASQEHGKAIAKTAEEAKKLQAIDQFGQKNATKIDAFENQAKDLAVALTKTEKDARVLYDTLIKMSQQDLDALAQDLEKVSAEEKLAADRAKDHADAIQEEKAATDSSVASFKSKITQLFGLYNIYQLIRRGINDAYQSIKQLDTAMNEIAVVTSMTTNELWEQIDTYMAVAKQYGVATQGVYEVSKLYYQQGRQAAEVTLLTAETLKMAKIAGLDYSKATDNMTVALNGFKMSAQDASTIVDVYSKLAAVAAVDTEELAYAMSKTASIAESAGMSFQNTSVFLTQMIETTREAPENIGTALKTIIARFQEMKKSPMDIIDVEGEEVSFNKVDQALKTIGMSLQDASGQFRDLDGVIYELADKWDSLDRNTQRYIATTVAGSRQQSRFLALMQDNSRLQELRVKATESEDAGLIQYSKTLDSLDSKLNQLATSFQELYMGIINGPVVKAFVDGIRFIVDNLNSLPKVISITLLPAIFILIKQLLTTIGSQLIAGTRTGLQNLRAEWSNTFRALIAESKTTGAIIQGNLANGGKSSGLKGESKTVSGQLEQSASSGVESFAKKQTVFLGKIYLIIAAISAVVAVVEMLTESTQEKAAKLKDTAEKTNIARAIAKDELTGLTQLKKKYDELNKIQNKTQEQTEEYNTIRTEIADKYPELIDYIDTEGNAILKMGDAYDSLAKKKKQAYEQAFVDNARAQLALSLDVFAAAAEQGFEGPGSIAEGANYGPEAWVVNSFKKAQNDKRFKSGESKLEDIAREYFNKENSTYTIYDNGRAASYDLNNEQEQDYASKIGTTYTQLALAAQSSQAAFEVAKKSFIQAQANFALQEADVSSNLAAQQLQKEGDILFAEIRGRKSSEDKTPAELAQIFSTEFAVKIAAQLDKRYNKDNLDSDEYKNAEEAFTQKDFISQKRFNELMSAGAKGYLEEEEKESIQSSIDRRYQAQKERYATMLEERQPTMLEEQQSTIFRGEDRGPYEQNNIAVSNDLKDTLNQKFKDFQERTSDAAAEYLTSMTDSALAILSSDSDQKTIKEKAAREVVDDAHAFMSAIYGASIDGSAETVGKIQSVLDTQDANSITGLFSLIDALKQMEELNVDKIDKAKKLRLDALVPTVNEKTAALASYISGMEEFNKIDLNDVSMTDALKYIDSEQYDFSWNDFEVKEDGKIQFKDKNKAQSEILGVTQDLFNYFAGLDSEWAKPYENWANSLKEQTDKEKLQSQLSELDFSDTYNDISVEQAEYLNTLLGGGLSFKDVLGGKRLSSDGYENFIKQLEDVAWNMDAGPERTAMLDEIKNLKQAINDSIQDYVDSIIGALDAEKNQAVLGKEELKWLGMSTSGLESAGIGQYIVQDVDGIIERIREKLRSEGYSNAEIEAEIAKYTEEREDFLKDEAKALSDALLSMLDANTEELLSQANANQFKDENLAKALAGRMGKKSITETNEGFSIDESTQDQNIEQIEKYFASRGKNLYDTMTLVAETEGQLDNITELQKALADAQLNNGQKEIALARQLASIIHSTMLDAESYNFMGNSKTNQELAPMYALMQSTQTAVTALQEASKSGKISTESLNAMLDFVGRDKTQFRALDKLSKQLNPPLETEMSAADAALLESAIKEKGAEKVKEYNDYVKGLNTYIDKLESTPDDPKLLSQYSYMGQAITSFNDILPALEVQLPAAEMQKLLGIGSLTGEKDMASFFAQLASAGILQKVPDPNAPSPVKDAAEAQKNLQGAIEQAEVDLDIKVQEVATVMTNSSGTITDAVGQISTQFGNVATAAETLSSRLSSIKLVVGGGEEDTSTPPASKLGLPTDKKLGFIRSDGSAGAAGGLTTKSEDALVGEFGPEIAVSDGKYYVVGKNGPEKVNLPQGSFILNHKETAKVLGKSTRALGDSYALSDYKLSEVGQNFGGVKSGKTDNKTTNPEDAKDKAEFDRWYNYLRLIEDVEQAITQLQAARENLSGTAYTQSQVNEIALLQQQERQVTKLRDAQRKYLTTVNADKIKQYGHVLSVVNGVLQINWDKLQGMDQKQAEPIQAVIAEWEDLNSSISQSNQEIEDFQKRIKDTQDAMRDTYIEVERQVIEAIKYRQQMVVNNLQKELEIKQKYDTQYLDSLRKNIEEERSMRERSDSETQRIALQRKLALLKRDTSGKSDLAIAETERQLRDANREQYDQKQDSFVQSETDAAQAAQEALQLKIEIQTEVLNMMSSNIQLIQKTVDDLLQSGPVNLTNFLSNWSEDYLNATPTEQQRFIDANLDKTGQAAGYLSYLSGDMKALVQGFNEGKWFPTTKDGDGTGSTNTDTTGTDSSQKTSSPKTNKKPKVNQTSVNDQLANWAELDASQATIYTGTYYSRITKRTYTATSKTSQNDANQKAKAKAQVEENKKANAQRAKSTRDTPEFAKGGLIDYTGPAIVHGSKRNPESVLTAKQTPIFQRFVDILDENFGSSAQKSMLKDAPHPNLEGAGTTVVVENINLQTGVISRDYDARRAGDLVKEEILNIAKYKGNMKIGKK